jgi:hypothetical protein
VASVAFSRTVLTKASPQGGARAKVHYIAREQSYSPGVRKVEYLGETTAHAVRNDLVYAETRNLPHWAKDAAEYFAAAEQYEHSKGVVLVENKFDLPKALPRDQQLALASDFLQVHLGDNHVVSWAMHEPLGLDGKPHPHVHALWSAREIDDVTRTPQQFFRRPNVGGARKTPALNQWNLPAIERQTYTDLANLYMERAGVDLHYHPGSLASRGLARTPEPKLLPSDSFAFASKGIVTEGMQKLFDHRQQMAPHRAEEAADAHQYWEHRKQQLGITRHVSHELALERIAEARTRSLTTPPRQRSARALEHEALGIERHITELEQHHSKLARAQVLEQAYGRMGRPIPERTAQQHAALLHEGQALGISRAPQPSQSLLADRAAARERQANRERPAPVVPRAREVLQGLDLAEDVSGPGVQFRLRAHEREQEHDRGIGW